MPRQTKMCPSKIIAWIWALAVTAGLNLSAIGPGSAPDQARAHPTSVDTPSGSLSEREKRARALARGRRFAKVGQSGLKPKPDLTSRRS